MSSTVGYRHGFATTPRKEPEPMEHWNLSTMDIEVHRPAVLESTDEGRAIAINLPAGESLQEHEVHERSWLVVIAGEVEIEGPDGDTVRDGAGLLANFAPHER